MELKPSTAVTKGNAFVHFYYITGLFLFCKLLQCVGSLKCFTYVSMLEKVCDFSYSWAVVSERSPFFCFCSLQFLLDSFFCVEFVVLGFVWVFAGSYYFVRLDVIESILFVLVFGVSGSECILEICLKAAILYSIGWFDKKLMFVTVVLDFRYITIWSVESLRIMRVSRKIIHLLLSSRGLSFCVNVFGLCIYWWGWCFFVWCCRRLRCRLYILCRKLRFLCK